MNRHINRLIVFIILIAILIFLILTNEKSTHSNDKNSPVDLTKNKTKTVSISKLNKNKTEIRLPSESIKKSQNHKHRFSYLELYEKNILAHDCKIIFKSELDIDKNVDPYTLLSKNISFKSNGRQQQVAKVQIQAMTDFIKQCKDLGKEVQLLIDKNHYKQKYKWSHPIIEYSSKRLYEAKPKTEEELAIVDTQNKLGKFEKIAMSYGAYVNGKSVLPKNEKKQIENEIKELRNLMYPKNPQINSSRADILKDVERRKKLQKEIDRKYQYLKDSIKIDEKRLQRYREHYAYLYPLVVKLLRTKYAYVFIDVLHSLSTGAATNGKAASNEVKKFILKFYPKYKTLDDMIYEGQGFKYRPYLDQIITPVKNMYLCYLGLDCSAQSRIIRNYCLGLNNYPIFQEACTTDLETFYYETYLSNNQRIDVEKILDYMVSEYAQ